MTNRSTSKSCSPRQDRPRQPAWRAPVRRGPVLRAPGRRALLGLAVLLSTLLLSSTPASAQLCAANTTDMAVQLIESSTGKPVSCVTTNTAYKLRVTGSRHNHLYCLTPESTYSATGLCRDASYGAADFPIQTNMVLPINGIHGSFSPGCTQPINASVDFGFPVCVPGTDPYTCATPPHSMESWWAFDDNLNTVFDLVGSNDGTGQNGAHHDAGGRVDGAYDFDGSNDYVRVPDHPTLDLGTGDFSIDAWIKTTGNGIIVSKRTAQPTVGYLFMIWSGRPLLQLGDPAGSWANYTALGAPAVTDGAWHHVAVTVDRDFNGIFYIDGTAVTVFDPENRDGDLSNSVDLWIGRDPHEGPAFNGLIDEVEIFDRALSHLEIAGLYAAGPYGKCKPDNGGSGGGGGGVDPCDLFCSASCGGTGGMCQDGQCICF